MVQYAAVTAAGSGFGMFETGEWTTFGTESGEFGEGAPEVQDAELSDYLGHLAEKGFYCDINTEIDGRVYDQGGDVYTVTDIETGDTSLVAVK